MQIKACRKMVVFSLNWQPCISKGFRELWPRREIWNISTEGHVKEIQLSLWSQNVVKIVSLVHPRNIFDFGWERNFLAILSEFEAKKAPNFGRAAILQFWSKSHRTNCILTPYIPSISGRILLKINFIWLALMRINVRMKTTQLLYFDTF